MGAPGARAPPRPSTAAPRSSPRGCAHTPRKTARAVEGAGRGQPAGGAARRERGRPGGRGRWTSRGLPGCGEAGLAGTRPRLRDLAGPTKLRCPLPRMGRQGPARDARGPGWRPGGGTLPRLTLPRLGRDPLTSGCPLTSEPLGVTLAPCGACSGDSLGLLSVSSRANSKLLAEDFCLELSWVCLLLTNKTQLVDCDLSPAGTFRSRVSGRVSPVSLMNSA